ncbi:SbcC/MukB-like Walker B domain-containing protein [Streptomyces sp. NPDC096176]|uniref:SbcC/MukB-like Walker B domain-containing protein n=1 Tax=Streptomyces sp. NPDC096176 TaxID=3366079 RepID=UPI0038084C42
MISPSAQLQLGEGSFGRLYGTGRPVYASSSEHHTLTQQLDMLTEQAAHQEQLAQRRAQAQLAQQLAPLLHAGTEAATKHTHAQRDEAAARALLAPAHAALSPDQLTAAEQDIRRHIGALQALLPDEARADQLVGELQRIEDERTRLTDDLGDSTARLEQAPELRAALNTRMEAARTAEEESRGLDTQLASLTTRLTAARHRVEQQLQADELTRRLTQAQTATRTAAQEHIGIRRRRTDGMAAELASQLTDGDACPVCGSLTHPAPAAPHPDQPTAADEQAAEARHTQAGQTEDDLQLELRKALERVGTARGTAGGDISVADLTTEHDALKQRLAEALAHAADAGPATEELAALERELDLLTRTHREAEKRLAAADATYDPLAAQREELDQRLTKARAGARTLTARITDLTQSAHHLVAAADTARATTRAADEDRQANTTASEAATTHGFASREAAEDALLTDTELQAIDKEINTWREQRAALTIRLEDADLAAAAAEPTADLTTATAELEAATTRHTQAANTADSAATRTTALADRTAQLDAHTRRLEPLEHSYRTADHLHGMISGTSPSNHLRMQLEAYVLAARLEEVVAAANTRLTRMSDHRYTLAHSDHRASHGARSGLGLKINDAWTGRDRDTDTLSGGESFFASLSLALGLADVVTAESGGQALDTLFIDEGFGTLDEDTLHDVLDVLDSLRAHDRTVGLISHVPELRRRITHRLHVRKDTTGSTLHQLTATAE